MKQKRVLTYQELELLVLLADNRGHPSWELEYKGLSGRKHTAKKLSQKEIRYHYNTVCMIDNSIKHGKLRENRKAIDARLSKVEIGKTIDPGQLSRLINKLESEGWIYRKERDKYINRPEKASERKLRGPSTEEPLYIYQDKYQDINRLIHEEIRFYRKQQRALKQPRLIKIIARYPNGSFETKLIHSEPNLNNSKKYKLLEDNYQEYVRIYWRWRARVRDLDFMRNSNCMDES